MNRKAMVILKDPLNDGNSKNSFLNKISLKKLSFCQDGSKKKKQAPEPIHQQIKWKVPLIKD